MVAGGGLCFSCLHSAIHCLIIRLQAHRRCLCRGRGSGEKKNSYFCIKNVSCVVCLLTDSILHPSPSPTSLLRSFTLLPMLLVVLIYSSPLLCRLRRGMRRSPSITPQFSSECGRTGTSSRTSKKLVVLAQIYSHHLMGDFLTPPMGVTGVTGMQVDVLVQFFRGTRRRRGEWRV